MPAQLTSAPAIPSEELAELNRIRAQSPESARLRNLAYGVINQKLRGANYQKDGVALKALSSLKDDSRITPLTIYSNKLDDGNLLELAIHPEKLAGALSISKKAAENWLEHLQHTVAHIATPKTTLKYPRVGIRLAGELDALLVAWHQLVEQRAWPSGGLTALPDSLPQASPLEFARIEKAAADAGFDLTPERDGLRQIFKSTAFRLALGVTALPNGQYKMEFSDRRWGQAVAEEGGLVLVQVNGNWPVLIEGIPSYPVLHQLFQRAGCLARVISGNPLEEFKEEVKHLPRTTEAERRVVQRVGQHIFKKALIEYWQGRCAVTSLDFVPLLRASHIKPWAKCDSDSERLDVFNGLLLAPHLDALFDDGWISFADDGALLLSSGLTAEQSALLGIHPDWKLARLVDQHRGYLDYHRQVIFRP